MFHKSSAPENVESLISSIADEINKLNADGPSHLNLDKFKAAEEKRWETDLHDNIYWGSYFHAQLQGEQKSDENLQHNEIFKAITVNDVKEAANQSLTGKNVIKLILMPEKK